MTTQTSFSDAQANLDRLCDRVIETKEPIVITRSNGESVALISEAELSSLLETLYLLRSPANAKRLLAAVERSKAGTIQPQTVDEICKKFGLDDNHDDEVASAG